MPSPHLISLLVHALFYELFRIGTLHAALIRGWTDGVSSRPAAIIIIIVIIVILPILPIAVVIFEHC
jgi:hypothetical protein